MNEEHMKDEIVVDGVVYVPKDISTEMAVTDGLRYCIIRCRNAGVHAGFVSERKGTEVTLIRTRRLWRWHGKTLSGLATEGTTSVEKCKYSDEIPEITVLDACEIIPCSIAGKNSIREAVGKWKNE